MGDTNAGEDEQLIPNKMKFQEAPFLAYLVKTLRPLSEADPGLVANYVVALLKNNKPKEELQKICIDQLHVFLGDGTKSFVTKLFLALEDGTISVDDLESRKASDGATTVVRGDSTELRSSSLQTERLTSAVVGAFTEHEEQEGSNDEDDDRNHKHTRRVTESPSLNWDTQDEDERELCRKRGRPDGNDQSVLQREVQISEDHQEPMPLRADREGSTKYHKVRHGSMFNSRLNVDGDPRRGSQIHCNEAAAPSFDGLNGCVHLPLGRGRGMNTGPWASRDSRFPSFETVDFPSAIPPLRSIASNLYPGRAILNHGNPTNPSWVAFGPIPGMANGGLEQTHLLHTGMQGGRGMSLSATIGIGMGMGRPRCRDFEERGFCLRGDICPMEHGANRIVVEDVQSLSQFNLPVSLPNRRLVGIGTGPVGGPSAAVVSSPGSARKVSHDKNIVCGVNTDSFGLNAHPTSPAGVEPDLYDPDQPLLNKDQPEASSGLRQLPSLKKGDDGHLWDIDEADRHSCGLPDVRDSARPQRCVSTTGLPQNAVPSVWDRIGPVDCVGNKLEGGGTTVNNSDGPVQHAKQPRNDMYNDQHSCGQEGRDNEMESDEDSGSKAVNIQLPHRKTKSVGTYGVHVESVSDSQKRDESCGHATRGNVARRSSGRLTERAQRTLFVNCIPPKNNKREFLLSHFKKFGEVLSIHIPPNSDKAFVQFSRREDANAALTAPDAVMGNRFIRLSWANWDSILEPGKVGATAVPPGRTRSTMPAIIPGAQILTGKERIVNAVSYSPQTATTDVVSGKPVTANDLPPSTISSVQKQETLETLKEEIRRKQEMLAKKREDFRRHLDKLAIQGISGRVEASDTDIAAKQQKMEAPSKCLNKSSFTMNLQSTPGPFIMTGNEQLVSKGTCGKLPKQMPGSRLQSPTFITQSSPKGLRLPFLSPTGSMFSPNRYKLDNRPTSFRILPPLPKGLMDIVAVKEHFALFGDLAVVELEDVESESDRASKIPETCVVRVAFVTRRAAEKAFIEGRCWQGQNLQLAWVMTSNANNHESRKNAPLQNSKGDSSGAASIEKEVAHGETAPVDETANRVKNVAEICMECSGQTLMNMVEEGNQVSSVRLSTSQLQATPAAEVGGNSSVGT